MQVVYERCCGLDIHKKLIVACAIVPGSDGSPEKEIQAFGTMTDDLLKLMDWLSLKGVTRVAMESTGVYWKPIYNLLEGSFDLLLVNAQHIKAVPGKKTDTKDCEWIADLLRHGLLTASFVPDRPQRELRELTRYRTSLVREKASEVNRLQKTLEGANIKLASVVSNVVGRSAREMLEALVEGSTDTKAMAELAKKSLRSKIPELERSLAGKFESHQRFMVAQQLAHIDALDEIIGSLGREVEERLRPFEETLERLETIPGVGRRTAEIILSEVGSNVDRFPTAHHLASWSGMAPGNNESAGKRKSGKTRDGDPWLCSALVEAAQSTGRKKGTYLFAQFQRLTAKRGKKRAAVAVGHTMLVIAYHIIKDGTIYKDLGPSYFDQRNVQSTQRRLVRRLEDMGFKVSLEAAMVAA